MLRINLSYSPLYDEFLLDYGPKHKDKVSLGNLEKLFDNLTVFIDFKRNIELYIGESVKDILNKELEDFFKDTKIKIVY